MTVFLPTSSQKQTAQWLRTPMAATMMAFDEQVRGRGFGLIAGSSDAEPLKQWITEAYGCAPEGQTVSELGAEIAGFYADQLDTTETVVASDTVWQAIMALATSPPYSADRVEALSGSALAKFTEGATIVLGQHGQCESSFDDVTPGGTTSPLAALTVRHSQGMWLIIEWQSVHSQVDNLMHSADPHMAQAASELPPWMMAGRLMFPGTLNDVNTVRERMTLGSGSAGQQRASSASMLVAILDAVQMGVIQISNHAGYLELEPPQS